MDGSQCVSMLLLSLLTIQSYKALLDAALAEHFPEIAPHLTQDPTASETEVASLTNGKAESKG